MSTTTLASVRQAMAPFGYVHRRDLVESGLSADAIRDAVHREGLIVLRRQWMLRPGIHPALHTAARAGGWVTCCTAARAMGLWHPENETRTHIAVAPHSSSCFDADVAVHRGRPLTPRAPRALTDTIENVLASVAECLPYDDARAVWESAIHEQKTTLPHLTRVHGWRPAARRLVADCTALADSGLETLMATRLKRRGIAMRQQVKIAGHRVDGLIGARLVVQIDGYAYHEDARTRRRDIAHDRALHLLGYTVLRFDYQQIMHDWESVEAQILQALAQGLHA